MPYINQLRLAKMSDKRIIPARQIETELTDRNSRFIASGAPAFNVNEAKAFIRSIEKKYPDATHHVPIYILGHGSSIIEHCSDDGEPSGTAGRPALAVLKGSGMGDIVVVITRYYGGTKLGTGGLVRAYSDSARQLINAIPRAKKIATTSLLFIIPYHLYEQTHLIIHNHRAEVLDKAFGADITLSVRVADELISSFNEQLIELTRGQISFITLEQNANTIMPI